MRWSRQRGIVMEESLFAQCATAQRAQRQRLARTVRAVFFAQRVHVDALCAARPMRAARAVNYFALMARYDLANRTATAARTRCAAVVRG